jgi:hypothetical protein
MKHPVLAASLAAGAVVACAMAVQAAPPPSTAVVDTPNVPSLASMMEKDLHWGMTHTEVTAVYNQLNGLFDREYAPLLAKLQPGVQQEQLEADRDSRKANFEHSMTDFTRGLTTGFDVSPLHSEYTYGNGESLQKLFKDGKNRYFFYIKDHLWKLYDEVPLQGDGPLGTSYQEAVTRLNGVLGVAGRVRGADPTQGLDRTETDWQDGRTHLRAIDRSADHVVGIALEDRNTLTNLASLRSYKAPDPFALDPAIANITRKGVSDPNATKAVMVDAGKIPK